MGWELEIVCFVYHKQIILARDQSSFSPFSVCSGFSASGLLWKAVLVFAGLLHSRMTTHPGAGCVGYPGYWMPGYSKTMKLSSLL